MSGSSAWFPFIKLRAISPGAQAYALSFFRQRTDCLVGNATMTLGHRNVWQATPQDPQGLNIPVDGLGGLTTGQLVGQPLFDLGTQGFSTTDSFLTTPGTM